MSKKTNVRKLVLSYLAGTLAVVAFVVLSAVAIVWANGLKFNPATWDFEKTVLIAISNQLEDVTVKLNDQIVATRTPFQQRDLLPGRYTVDIEKLGFVTWSQTFWLSAGQVGLIKEPVLIAEKPLITEAANSISFADFTAYDAGLAVKTGELQDRGVFITRFGSTPVQIHRFRKGYVYQTGAQLRLFFPEGNHDFFIQDLPDASLYRVRVFESTWQVAIQKPDGIQVIDLGIPSNT